MANIAFWEWVEGELGRRRLTYHRVEREARVANATVSKPARNRSEPSVKVCRAIAQAFGMELEVVYRRAGLLPALPAEVEEEREALRLFRSLGREVRAAILATMRNLLGLTGAGEGGSFSELLAQRIARELEGMPLADQQRVFDLMRRLRGAEGGEGEPVAPDS
jgi:transcriptional regulator with XRE-family HTH domain